MERLLERLDGAFSTIVPLLYLVGLAAGTLAYFTDIRLGFTLTVGVCLALAAEVHSFLQQRRLRSLWAVFTRPNLDEDTRESLVKQLWVQGGILAGLVAFSAYNATAFVASTWTPAPGWLPASVQIGIRGLVVPVLFLLTGFLSPLTVDAGAILAHASREMLHHTIKTTVKQWRTRIARARKRGLNLAPVAVALMLDAGDTDGARRVQMIDSGLAYAEAGGDTREALAPTLAGGIFTPTGGPDRGGDDTPTGGPDRGPGGKGGAPRPRGSSRGGPTLRLVSDAPTAPRNGSGMTRAQQEALLERDMTLARDILASEPDISTRKLAARLSVGRAYPCHPQRAGTIRLRLAGEDGVSSTAGASQGARARA